MKGGIYTTEQLLDYVKEHVGETIEAEIIHDVLRATHWFSYWESRFWHEGIDGERYRTSRRQLVSEYPTTRWFLTYPEKEG